MGSSGSRHNLRDIHWGATGEKSPILVKSGDISKELSDGSKRNPASITWQIMRSIIPTHNNNCLSLLLLPPDPALDDSKVKINDLVEEGEGVDLYLFSTQQTSAGGKEMLWVKFGVCIIMVNHVVFVIELRLTTTVIDCFFGLSVVFGLDLVFVQKGYRLKKAVLSEHEWSLVKRNEPVFCRQSLTSSPAYSTSWL